MRLQVTTPQARAIDETGVVYVRAEDATGSFGIQRGHADFVTRLAVSVLTWRGTDGAEHHVAVRGGVLRVHGGEVVEVATRQAVKAEKFEDLRSAVLSKMRQEALDEAKARTRAAQLDAAVVRRLYNYARVHRPARRMPLGEQGESEGGS